LVPATVDVDVAICVGVVCGSPGRLSAWGAERSGDAVPVDVAGVEVACSTVVGAASGWLVVGSGASVEEAESGALAGEDS